MFSEDNVAAQVRYRAIDQNPDGDANECGEPLSSITIFLYIQYVAVLTSSATDCLAHVFLT